MPVPRSIADPDLSHPDADRARRRATVRAVAVRVVVAAIAYTLLEVVCALAGWDSGSWSVIAVFVGFVGYDRVLNARQARRLQRQAGPDGLGAADR